MTRNLFATCNLTFLGVLLLLPCLAVNAQDRPRIMPSPRPTLAPNHAGLVYRDTGSLPLRANVYLPESDQPTAAIAWFAGGGFRLRDYRMIRGSIFDQLARGVAIISFEYTLADEAKWPAQAYDGKAAVRWLRSKAQQYNIDPERIFIAGASAGAILANVVANSSGDESLEETGAENANFSAGVNGVISFYTAADLTTHSGWPDENSSGNFLTGCASIDCKAEVEGASPAHYVSANSPPALLFHGMGDVVIDYSQSILLQQRLNDAGVDAQLVLRSDLVHGDTRFDEPAVSDLITRFLSASVPPHGLH
jgi:acetyl esterase/lipase